MQSLRRFFVLLSLIAGSQGQCLAQISYPAPSALPAGLIYYSSYSLGYTDTRVVLYNSNQTYTVISSISGSLFGTMTVTPTSGTFTYTIDPANPAHATIVYGNGAGSDELYFATANAGIQTSSYVTFSGLPYFTIFPKQNNNGAVNQSNRSILSAGATTTSGIVIQAGNSRWVLFRAAGASLRNFDVANPVAAPSFTVYDSSGMVVGNSVVWSADPNLMPGFETIFSIVGAFPFTAGSDEAVLLAQLKPGAYTAVFQAANSGTILAEAYVLPY